MGQRLCGPFRGCLDGFQGDQEWLHKTILMESPLGFATLNCAVLVAKARGTPNASAAAHTARHGHGARGAGVPRLSNGFEIVSLKPCSLQQLLRILCTVRRSLAERVTVRVDFKKGWCRMPMSGTPFTTSLHSVLWSSLIRGVST